MEIPNRVQEVIEEADLAWVGTCLDDVPNVNIVGFFKVISDNEMLLADNYFYKTRKNLIKNPKIALTVKNPDKLTSYQLKGDAKIIEEGDLYEEMKEWVSAEKVSNRELPKKAAVKINVKQIYNTTPGDKAGKKLELVKKDKIK